jgi:putative endonuclease
MVRFISPSQAILLAVLGNVDQMLSAFVRDYGVHRLIFVEFHETMADAILREKRLKRWRRAWKLELIERHNPQWRDLYEELT